MATAGTIYNFKRRTPNTPLVNKSQHCPKCGAACYVNPNGKLIRDWNCDNCAWCNAK